jgi:hypothetical protein
MSAGLTSLVANLSAEDIRLLTCITSQMIALGLWESSRRSTDEACDCFEIQAKDERHSMLTFGVLLTHRYFFMNHRTGDVEIADTLADLLDRAGLLPLAQEAS